MYDYFLKGHLGNTRMVITDDYSVSSPILETSSYYPFGLMRKGIGTMASNPNQQNKYLFNGKELQSNEFNDGSGLDMMDFNARMYDMQLGKFWQQDPFTSAHQNYSSYSFAYNNPVAHNDPFGLDTLIMHPEPGVYSTYIADGKMNGPTYWGPHGPANYSYDAFASYYDDARKKGHDDYSIEKSLSQNFPYLNNNDLSLFWDASSSGNASYRDYINKYSHRDQLYALGALASPLLITAAPEAIAAITTQGAISAGVDITAQLITNAGDITQVNMVSVAASGIIGNPFVSALPGSVLSYSFKKGFEVNDPNSAFINYYYGTMGNLIGFGAGKAFGNALKATAIQTAASVGTTYISNETVNYANGTKG